MSDTTDIAALMRKDPLAYSNIDLKAVIAYMRGQRHQFKLRGEVGRAPAAPKISAKAAEVLKSVSGLDELDL